MAEKIIRRLLAAALIALAAAAAAGCSAKTERRIVIWADNSEFAPYIELFNEQHASKAVLVYKENLSTAIPAASDELQPDIIVGSWLRNERTKRTFKPADYLFDRNILSASDFYSMLLEAGRIGRRHYLIPVSFNLPAVIFSTDNEEFIEGSYMISLEQLRKAGAAYNKKNAKGAYTRIGFAPQSSDEFLYHVVKVSGADFKESKNTLFTWNEDALEESIRNLKEWISTENTSVQTESDFVYKYLSVKDDKRVLSGRTLFAYMTSDKLFQLSSEQLAKIDFRWLQNNNSITVDDSMPMMGIARHARNTSGATEFISWFFKAESQQLILDRKAELNLDTSGFGIAGGFSAVRKVNEYVLPAFYTTLLSNIPQADSFIVSEKKTSRWEKIKQNVIIPYIKESIAAPEGRKVMPIAERFAEWKKLGFN
ncbi:MAG: hypothetical protein K2H09_02105 [Treponemataceae bacterium]|nr:hypothetical protein [Treponemataceae bacterium]